MSVPKLYQKIIMATYQKRGDKWRAIIRRANYPTMSKTFPTKKLAEEWALSIEAPMTAGELEINKELQIIPVSALIRKYIAEVTPSKKSAKGELLRLNATLRDYPHLFNKPIESFTKKDVIAWRDERLKKVKPSSVSREWSSLSAVFTTAIEEWSLPIKNHPFREAKRPPSSKHRYRRISDEEIEQMLEVLDWHEEFRFQKHYVAWCFLFAIETAMRSGEILKLKWSDIDGKLAHLYDTKNGESRAVPLSSEARRLLDLLPRDDDSDKLIPLDDRNRDVIFRECRAKTDIVDLHFHDTRHEALSRMAKVIVNPMDLAKISGHKDLQVLMNVYYNPSNEHLADLLG
ncbi:MAG: site-specific integrase [Gammaproteobacteria bacterium]|nr:site-specific integrase [Gammaproteobacteria bacterium]